MALACAIEISSLNLASASTATSGSEIWARRHIGISTDSANAKAVAVSPNGAKVFVTGWVEGTSGLEYETVGYKTSDGAELWSRRYGTASGFGGATSIVVSPNGSTVFVTGRSGNDFGTVAYRAATGATLWAKTYDGPGRGDREDGAVSLAMDPRGGKVFVTGYSYNRLQDSDYATVAYGAGNGHVLWVKRYDGPAADDYDGAVAVAVSPDGSAVYVTGAAYQGTMPDYRTLAYRASDGALRWVKRFDTGPGYSDDRPTAIAVSPDGARVFVTGNSQRSDGADSYTVAYAAASGAEVWVNRYDGSKAYTDAAASLAVSPDGTGVFVTGLSVRSTGGDFATRAYRSSNGATMWVRRYDGPSGRYDQARSVAVSPDGNEVVVTGDSKSSTARDYATLAYRTATGAEIWLARYDSPAHHYDYANAVAFGPFGHRVFVTGGSGSAYATVAYAA